MEVINLKFAHEYKNSYWQNYDVNWIEYNTLEYKDKKYTLKNIKYPQEKYILSKKDLETGYVLVKEDLKFKK